MHQHMCEDPLMGCPAKERAREVKRAAATAPQTSGLEDSAALAEGAVLTMLQGYTVIVPCPSPNCLPLQMRTPSVASTSPCGACT